MLAVMSRLPVAGRTKTRLIPALGAEGAAALQRDMTSHTLREACFLSSGSQVSSVVWFEGGSAAEMRAAFGAGREYRSQCAGDLGARIRRAIDSAFAEGAGRVVVVGCDCPELGASRMREAFAALEGASVVLGPATDGGYYLIGMRSDTAPEALAAAFAGISWGTPSVFEATATALRAAGVAPAVLPALSDVDEEADLPVWHRASAPPASLAVVIPALNEAGCVAAAVRSARRPGIDVVVADGESEDGTQDVSRWAGARVIEAHPGRARQMNAGAAATSADALLFLHADTVLPDGYAARALAALADPEVVLGAFSFGTDLPTPAMRLFERGTNWRARRGMPYGDQALFMRTTTFRSLGGFPDMPVMEDYEFVRRARTCGRVVVLDDAVVTSGRAWRERGVWRTMLANRLSVLAYRLGAEPAKIAGWRSRRSRAV